MNNFINSFPDPDDPLACTISYYFKKPTHAKRLLPTTRPDLDNVTKPTLDSLKPLRLKRKLVSCGVIADDAQITDLYIRKRYTLKSPKIIITLWKITLQNHHASPDLPIQALLNLMPE